MDTLFPSLRHAVEGVPAMALGEMETQMSEMYRTRLAAVCHKIKP